jgi:acetyl-CoA carboxylase biotin carboxyl carrier protein
MGYEDLKELIDMLKDTDIMELQIEREGVKIKIRRDRYYVQQPETPALFMPGNHQVCEEVTTSPEQAPESENRFCTISSPIVGTFYRSPSPELPPFVEVGTRVKKGQVLCIIEAMKLMNEIESEVDGVVTRIMVENGHPVEYGEPLFLIDTEA